MILEMLKSYQQEESSVESIIEQYNRLIIDKDSNYKSIIHLSQNSLLKAKELDHNFNKTRKLKGRLHGIPVVIKANIFTADNIPTSCGSVILKDFYPNRNANIVDWLIHEGAIIIGKSNMSEFSNYISNSAISGFSSLGGQTKCIFGEDFTSGGSSSGSAVAVAALFCCLAIGTETDGSVVYLAAHNGTFAFKFKPQQVSTDGIIGISSFFDSIGLMTNNLDDLEYTFSLLVNKPIKNSEIKNIFIQDKSFNISGSENISQKLLLKIKEYLLQKEIHSVSGKFIEIINPLFEMIDIICQSEFKKAIKENTHFSEVDFILSCRRELLGSHYQDIHEIERSFSSNYQESGHYQNAINTISELRETKAEQLNIDGIDLILSLTLGPEEIASTANLAGLNHLVIPIHLDENIPISLSIMATEEKAHLGFIFADNFLDFLKSEHL
jgi:Asp-tRNA(Asn)/Glu-tRNA(Gln) amidotransferase A subunit family amidase